MPTEGRKLLSHEVDIADCQGKQLNEAITLRGWYEYTCMYQYLFMLTT